MSHAAHQAPLSDLPAAHPLNAVLRSVADGHEPSVDELLQDAVHALRLHQGMDIAFISEFLDGRRYFRYVDSANDQLPVSVGGSDPLEASYCHYVADGRMPRLMHDAARDPIAMTLPATTELPVGAHLSVPIYLNDGHIYGTFCCFKTVPDPTLVDRDLALVQMFAEFTGKQLDRQLMSSRAKAEMHARIDAIIETESFAVVYQPIFDLSANRIVGFEALARFAATPIRPPNVWFEEAAQVGREEALEMAVLTQALQGLVYLPDDSYLTLNVSPALVMGGQLIPLLARAPGERIVLELTEHVSIPDYDQLRAALAALRDQGVRLAVDDAGAGYASFRHILQLMPDLIKLDISLTRNIDTDATRRALAAALIRFAEETGSTVIAEGVETDAELVVLQYLRISHVQGYLIGRAMPLTTAVTLLQSRAYGDSAR